MHTFRSNILVVAFWNFEIQIGAKMSADLDVEQSTGVKTIRESVKDHIRIARLKHRQDEVDSLRITLGELEDHSINLETYSTADVTEIATKIKRQRNASHAELLKLCHAFLQSTENISCFLNSTGSIQVIVKEMTGKPISTFHTESHWISEVSNCFFVLQAQKRKHKC